VILYLDTSSLVKLYVEEAGSQEVRDLLASASLVATSVVAYPEARSALARLRRGEGLTETEYRAVRADLEEDWRGLLAIPVAEAVWRRAGELAERHGLCGFEGIHLASYLWLAGGRSDIEVRFSSWDERLNRAAGAEAGEG
jgi:predicted nucleic acid-binding protein